ncbi:MAG TPA: DUF2798 domain-containing protein [Methylophilaceae bacterium]|nr:DUF2798 domain-containing protein [Methylophilaceae bacterium]
MIKKFPRKFRQVVFAAIMSIFTVMIVSATITFMHVGISHQFMGAWIKAFCAAWPIVFTAILIIAPVVNKVVDKIVD